MISPAVRAASELLSPASVSFWGLHLGVKT